MEPWEQAAENLPPGIRGPLERVPAAFQETVQEIRLRRQSPVVLSAPSGEWWVTRAGEPTVTRRPDLLCCLPEQLEDCFLRLCGYSIHTHQEEIRQGFVTAANGCRAGIGGTAVMENGVCISMREITSLCLRVARIHEGCAGELVPRLFAGGELQNVLLCGEPGSGKTSLLRDIARALSAGEYGPRRRVAVVDERGELSLRRSLPDCDVLTGCPKAQGVLQAVRCLAPEVVVFDELGDDRETQAVRSSLQSGVAVVASCHGRDMPSLLGRPAVAPLLLTGAFARVALLRGHGRPGQIQEIVEVREWLAENSGTGVDRGGRNRGGFLGVDPPATAGDRARGGGPVPALYRR